MVLQDNKTDPAAIAAPMAEKKIQENPLSEEVKMDKPNETTEIPSKDLPEMEASLETAAKDATKDKMVTIPLPNPVTVTQTPRLTPSFTKTPPNDLYRRLLPAVLFVLTFVTVMTMLLIYMDTVALGAQQFRLNMSRDYELSRIPQESEPLVAYVRQVHLAPRAGKTPPTPDITPAVEVLDRLYGVTYNGTFVDFLPSGPQEQTSAYLERARGWDGVVARAAARDYLALRGSARALHACLSSTPHPREVSYGGGDPVFSLRVLCLPLYTVLAAGEALRARYVLLGAPALPALRHLPFRSPALRVQVFEIKFPWAASRNETTQFLLDNNYSVVAEFKNSTMYALREDQV